MAVRVALVGAGGMGRHHAKLITAHPSARVVAVADADHAAATDVARAVGAGVASDGLEAITASDVDAVVIASPDATHAEYAVAALEAAKPVLCEKPLGDTVAQARAALHAEVAGGRRLLQLGLMRVYDPPHIRLRAAVSELGAIRHVRAVHRNRNDVVRSANLVLSQSLVHEIHSIRWLTGSEFRSVMVRATPRPGGGVRYATVSAELVAGGLVTIEFDDRAFGYDVSVEIATDTGSVALDPPDDPARHGDWFGWFAEAYEAEVDAWIGAAAGGTATGPTCWDGLAAQVVVEACRTSLGSGRPAIVELPPRPVLYG